MSLKKRLFKLCDELFQRKDANTKEVFPKKIASLFARKDASTDRWYVYQISIQSSTGVNDQLGFLVPAELITLPKFNDGRIILEVKFQRTLDVASQRLLLERFSKHIFEHVFGYTTLEFDMHSSTFKLFPCLLTRSHDVDFRRMSSICSRHQKPVEDPANLSDIELYTLGHLPNQPWLIYQPNSSLVQQAASQKMVDHTYADHYEKVVPNLRIRRDRPVYPMRAVSKMKVSIIMQEHRVLSTNQTIFYHPIKLLHYAPLNRPDLELISLLPSILVRIVQLYHLERMRKLFAESINCYPLTRSSEATFKDCLAQCTHMASLDHLNYDFASIPNAFVSHQPSTDILFQAITRCSAGELVDMEGLENLGDCFLKLTVSISIYYQFSRATVSELNGEKVSEISNENLYRLALVKNLRNYLYCDRLVFQGKDGNWLPPGFVNRRLEDKRHTHQIVKRKAFADMIEALIGAFLISSGYMTTVRFMHWLGLNVIPLHSNGCLIDPPPGIIDVPTIDVQSIFISERFGEVEAKLGYVFRTRAYLIAAFTHPSKYTCHTDFSYERLEFLGDALLDFLIVRHAFINYEHKATPAQVTYIRQGLANNNRLANVLAASGLHTKIRHQSLTFSEHIRAYIGSAPKILADVLEAVLAAVFLDSSNSLQAVWGVVERLFGEDLNLLIVDPQRSTLR